MTGERQARWWAVEIAACAVLAVVAVALRTHRLELGWFGVDQARDVATALDVASGRAFPTIGPTMRRVTRLGAGYYYFWSFPYVAWRDPLAGYWFAAVLSLVGVALTWRVARRTWGPLAGVATLAVAAAHPVWVVDGRIAWAPAALPAASGLLLALMPSGAPGTWSTARAAAIGATLGLAVQLHLAMVAWVAAVFIVAALARPSRRAVLAALGTFVIVGAPAAYAVLVPPPTEAGVAALALDARGVEPFTRLAAIAALPVRVAAALAWPTSNAAAVAATALLAVAIVAGMIALVIASLRPAQVSRLAAVAASMSIALVALLPGAPWYYYLDGILPALALGVGALVASIGGVTDAARAHPTRSRTAVIVTGIVVAAALATAGRAAVWLGHVAQDQYVTVDPAQLTLASQPGRDAAVRGRLVTLAAKRDVAETIVHLVPASRRAAAVGIDTGDDERFADVWYRLHGPAWEDVTGDNGFWLRRTLAGSDPGPVAAVDDVGREVSVWYRDDPLAAAFAAPTTAAIDVRAVGPVLVVAYDSSIERRACVRDGNAPVVVPVRAVPDPQRYGDGTAAMPAELPSHVRCALRPGAPPTRIVAALGGPGRVQLAAGDAHDAGTRAAVCAGADGPGEFDVDVTVPFRGATTLDVYDVPGGCDPAVLSVPAHR